MKRQKCSACGKNAFAYRLEEDGTKTYLCLNHLPTGKAPDAAEIAPHRDGNRDKPRSP
jgi:hypothetical protein